MEILSRQPKSERLSQRVSLEKIGDLADIVNKNEMNYRTARRESIISGAIGRAMSSLDR